MKSPSLMSSMCRACALRTTTTQSTRLATATFSSAAIPTRTRTASTSTKQPAYRSLPQPTRRHLTTAPSAHDSATSGPYNLAPEITPATATGAPTTTTTPLSPAVLLSQPTPPANTPGPLLTATITSLHARTAHATRTIPLPSRHLHKSFLTTTHDLVHDPYDILRVGDVIRYSPFTADEQSARESIKEQCREVKWAKLKAKPLIGRRRPGDGKRSKRVRVKYVVRQVVSAWGQGLEERVVEMENGKRAAAELQEVEAREANAPAAQAVGGAGGGKMGRGGAAAAAARKNKKNKNEPKTAMVRKGTIVADVQAKAGILEV